MPTIDELLPADAVADDDYVPVSQAGVMRRVTRTQMLAGTQPALALGQGTIVGRSELGYGRPEAITIGENLRLRNGVLSATASFNIGGLAAAGAVSAADVVAVSQGGRDAGLSVGSLLAGLAKVPGLDLSGQIVRSLAGFGRSLAAWMGDAASVEAFGAVGDGVTDDTAAIDRAVASGLPVRFGARTYVLNGQWTVTRPTVMIGVEGATVLKRSTQAGGAWISIRGSSFSASGIIFDAGRVTGESWGVLVEPACSRTLFERCVFRNATGGTLGSGLVIQARDEQGEQASRHVIRGCEAYGNAAHGIWVQAASGAVVDGCVVHDNAAYGICLDFNDPLFRYKVQHSQVSGCLAYANRRGISVGNYNETNAEPARWGLLNPDAVGVGVSCNRCHGNWEYGIAVAGEAMQVMDNLLERNGSGMLVNAAASLISDNVIRGPGQYGIDSGGSSDCDLVGNLVQGFAVGINPGGSRMVRLAGNALVGNVWGMTVFGTETDGRGTPFGIPCSGLTIEGNRFQLKDGSGGGVLLADAPQGVSVLRNSFVGGAGSDSSQALWAHTDQVVVRGNEWNHQGRMICNPVDANGLQQVQVCDALDGAMLTSADRGVASVVGQHQAAMSGRLAFIKVTNGGRGYSSATVVVSGSGTGARAIAYVRDGAVIGIAVEASGYGYSASGISVVIQGDGTGAQAVGSAGLPVSEGRRMRLHCNGPVRFKRVGSFPFQDNWTGVDILVPPASVVDWVGAWGGWQAVSFPLADYVAPAGDGGLTLRSVSNDMVFRPAGSGRVRVSSDAEPVGFASLLGRGNPEGFVAAPAGSDYRNLNGGAGTTLWLKRTGSGASGWASIG